MFSGSGRTFDDQVQSVSDPVPGGELGQRGPGNAAPRTAIDILDVSTDAQFGLAQFRAIAFLFAMLDFALKQHGDVIVEAEFLDPGELALFV